MTDAHDPRPFRQFVKLNPDGTVAATVQVAHGAPDPEDGVHVHVDVTAHYPADVGGLRVDPVLVETLTQHQQALAQHKATIRDAQAKTDGARQTLARAVVKAISAPKVIDA